MARILAWIALRLTIATAVQDGTAVAPNPFDAPTTHEVAHRHRKHTHAESATCYGRRYPDLAYHFCEKGGCDVHALHDHFRDHGRREGRRFGCEAAPLTAAEAARWEAHRGKRISGRDLVAMGHMKCGQPPDVRDCRPDDVAARLHTECAGWNEKDPLKRFTDEHRVPVLNEVIDRGVHVCTKKGSDEIIRATRERRRLLGLLVH